MKKHSAPSLHLLAATTFSATTMSSAQPFRGGRSRGRGRGRRNFSDHPSGEGNEQDIGTGDSHFNSVRQTNRNFRPRAPMPNIRPNQQIYGQLPPPQPFNHNQQSYRAMAPPPGIYQNQQFNRAPQYLRNHQFNRPNYYDNRQLNRPNFNENQQFNRPNVYENQQFNQPNFYENQQFNRPNVYENRQFNRPNFHGNQQFRPRPLPPKALNFRNWEYAKPGPPSHCEKTLLSHTTTYFGLGMA